MQIIRHGVRSGMVVEAMTVQLIPPLPFPFHRSSEWQRWKRRFEQASGLSTESQQRKVSSYTPVYDGRGSGGHNNVIFERAKLNCRCQKQDESVEQFITCLYQLSENCA